MKYLFVDIDGVIINGFDYEESKRKPWYITIDSDLGIKYTQISDFFFSKEFKEVLVGKKDLKIEISRYFENRHIFADVDVFVNYWFKNDSNLNLKVINDICKSSADKKYLVTIQENYRAHYLWEVIGLKKHFDGMLFSGSIGYLKDDKMFYHSINQQLNIAIGTDRVTFFDDNPDFVKVAKECGWNSILYTGEQLIK